jgi:hypothetical protein
MKKLAYAFAVALAISSLGAQTASAMNLGSLSRDRPMLAGAELTTSSVPNASGAGNRKSADISPALRIIFISIGGFVRSHLDYALENGRSARIQLISMASAG